MSAKTTAAAETRRDPTIDSMQGNRLRRIVPAPYRPGERTAHQVVGSHRSELGDTLGSTSTPTLPATLRSTPEAGQPVTPAFSHPVRSRRGKCPLAIYTCTSWITGAPQPNTVADTAPGHWLFASSDPRAATNRSRSGGTYPRLGGGTCDRPPTRNSTARSAGEAGPVPPARHQRGPRARKASRSHLAHALARWHGLARRRPRQRSPRPTSAPMHGRTQSP